MVESNKDDREIQMIAQTIDDLAVFLRRQDNKALPAMADACRKGLNSAMFKVGETVQELFMFEIPLELDCVELHNHNEKLGAMLLLDPSTFTLIVRQVVPSINIKVILYKPVVWFTADPFHARKCACSLTINPLIILPYPPYLQLNYSVGDLGSARLLGVENVGLHHITPRKVRPLYVHHVPVTTLCSFTVAWIKVRSTTQKSSIISEMAVKPNHFLGQVCTAIAMEVTGQDVDSFEVGTMITVTAIVCCNYSIDYKASGEEFTTAEPYLKVLCVAPDTASISGHLHALTPKESLVEPIGQREAFQTCPLAVDGFGTSLSARFGGHIIPCDAYQMLKLGLLLQLIVQASTQSKSTKLTTMKHPDDDDPHTPPSSCVYDVDLAYAPNSTESPEKNTKKWANHHARSTLHVLVTNSGLLATSMCRYAATLAPRMVTATPLVPLLPTFTCCQNTNEATVTAGAVCLALSGSCLVEHHPGSKEISRDSMDMLTDGMVNGSMMITAKHSSSTSTGTLPNGEIVSFDTSIILLADPRKSGRRGKKSDIANLLEEETGLTYRLVQQFDLVYSGEDDNCSHLSYLWVVRKRGDVIAASLAASTNEMTQIIKEAGSKQVVFQMDASDLLWNYFLAQRARHNNSGLQLPKHGLQNMITIAIAIARLREGNVVPVTVAEAVAAIMMYSHTLHRSTGYTDFPTLEANMADDQWLFGDR
eukprot:Ihof_evm44s1 gene=Ihof_evmTU44s1